MEQLQISDTLVKSDKKGNGRYWRMMILSNGENIYTQTEYWSQTKDGESERQLSAPKLIKGKNIGRSNETTPLQQAQSELASEIKKQRDKTYRLPGEELEALPLPMLAHEYTKHKKKVTFPCLAQPKYDGVRALYKTGVGFWSRQGKMFLPAVTQHLMIDAGEHILDGELILPAPFTFQQTISAIKKYDPEVSPQLLYRVYDVVNDQVYEDRKMLISLLQITDLSEKILAAPTKVILSEELLYEYHRENIGAGWEGTMIRTYKGKYASNHRSHDLLKLKDFEEAEFEILKVVDGQAKEEGCAIFICKTQEGKQFNVRPKGTVEERQEIFNNSGAYIGKPVTVRYQELTDEGVPRFPVAIGVRDYEC